MEVTTRLTWIQERVLGKLLGNTSLTLLYKSGAHGLHALDMIQRCSHQGSTMTVFHLKQDVVGIFMLEHFPVLHSKKPSTCVLFAFKENTSTGTSALFLNAQVEINTTELKFFSSDDMWLTVNLKKNKLHLSGEVIKELELNLKCFSEYLECEIFRVDGVKNDPGFIKKMLTAKQHRRRFLSALRAYRPSGDLVSEVRILLVGPVGSGKSSFFNSVKSAFYGHFTRQAVMGSDETSITKQYRTYSVKNGEGGKTLPFILCDSMGLDEREEAGLCLDDILHILKGFVPDRYQFDPCKPIKPRHLAYNTSPPLKDRIHCVAYVLNINSVNSLSDKMVAKLKRIQRDVIDCGIGQVVLLTNVDNCDEVLDDNFTNMTESTTSQSQVKKVQNMLTIPVSNILMVSNYTSEQSMHPIRDILIFAALRQMLRAADDSLEDLPLENRQDQLMAPSAASHASKK
ncbi:interferon-induced protein 44-like isoform X5 [Cricetulus griseus]|uniref:Interferon-induced protein 44-like isoform X3 n=1 Tax=Cricetulus griseus TaxID=10029 RepID=A0A9J7F4L5_CRIGR|nr:interferon-induced protein 44-like isoform X3 [Cricetulus griseus]XP_035309584.1 interferon-induced protein 44-like isoform X5 [Cricetulus griseus]